jgi:hypothetical protein
MIDVGHVVFKVQFGCVQKVRKFCLNNAKINVVVKKTTLQTLAFFDKRSFTSLIVTFLDRCNERTTGKEFLRILGPIPPLVSNLNFFRNSHFCFEFFLVV